MTHLRSFAALSLALVISGCGSKTAPTQETGWRFAQFSDRDLSRCKEVAVKAASSPDVWQQFNAKRITDVPFTLDMLSIDYQLDLDHLDMIHLLIPSGGKFGRHRCFVRVTIRLGTFEVVGIEESFWP